MDYNTVVDLENVLLEDSIDLFEKRKIITVIEDGKISNFKKETDKNENN